MLSSTLKKIKALRAFDKEVYFKVIVKTFPGAWRNHEEQTGMKVKEKNIS